MRARLFFSSVFQSCLRYLAAQTFELAGFRSSLPIVVIQTDGLLPMWFTQIRANTTVFPVDAFTGYASLAPNSPRQQGWIGIEPWDPALADEPKPTYLFESWTASGKSSSTTFGNLSGTFWVLDAMDRDESLMRAPFMMSTWAAMGSTAPIHQLVEVFLVIGGTGLGIPQRLQYSQHYQGVYMLALDIGSKRWLNTQYPAVPSSASPADRGYVFSTVMVESSAMALYTNVMSATLGWQLELQYPQKWPEFSVVARDYIFSMLNSIDRSLAASTADAYSIIDPVSFADYLLLGEVGYSVEGFAIAATVHKPPFIQQLRAGPVLERGLSLGNSAIPDGLTVWIHCSTHVEPDLCNVRCLPLVVPPSDRRGFKRCGGGHPAHGLADCAC
jgi:hypothetical protein